MSKLKDYISDLYTVNEECISVAKVYRNLLMSEKENHLKEVNDLKKELEERKHEISKLNAQIQKNKLAEEVIDALNSIKRDISSEIKSSSESQKSSYRKNNELLSQLDTDLKNALGGISKDINGSDYKIDNIMFTVQSLVDANNNADEKKHECVSADQEAQSGQESTDEKQDDRSEVTGDNNGNTDSKNEIERLETIIGDMDNEEFYEKLFRNSNDQDGLLVYIVNRQIEKGVIGNAAKNSLERIIGGKQ